MKGDCWLWPGGTDSKGYGRINYRQDGRQFTRAAHRVVYEALRGPIPIGLDLDHLCRNRVCVNPWHMEPVTRSENLRRGEGLGGALRQLPSHCKNGHPRVPENRVARTDGPGDRCLICLKERVRGSNPARVRPSDSH